MGGSQPHRSGDAQAPGSGTCNRGFVSNDPERQREPVTEHAPRSKVQPPGGIRFTQRPPGAPQSARQQAEPDVAGADAAPQGRGSKRRSR